MRAEFVYIDITGLVSCIEVNTDHSGEYNYTFLAGLLTMLSVCVILVSVDASNPS